MGTVLGSFNGLGFVSIAFGALRIIFSLVGVILIIIGRDAFEKNHSTYVLLSVVLYIAGGVIGFITGLAYAFSLIQAARSQGVVGFQNALASNFNQLLVGVFIGVTVSGVAYVLVSYALQRSIGRALLWAAYVASLVIGIATLYIIGPQVTNAVQAAYSGGTFNRAPLDDLQAQASSLGLLGAIPTVIYALSYYLAWSRVNNGEIPEQLSQLSTPGSPTI